MGQHNIEFALNIEKDFMIKHILIIYTLLALILIDHSTIKRYYNILIHVYIIRKMNIKL